MTASDDPNYWLNVALSGKTVVDVGQLSATEKRCLNAATKAGRLLRWREPWMGCIGSARFHWTGACTGAGNTG